MSTGGIKNDEGKLRYDLVPVEALEEVVKVLTFGANKYADRNWEKGFRYGRPFAACMRHLLAWWGGENTDPETGYSHLAHAACCLFFLLTFERRNAGEDDRPIMNVTVDTTTKHTIENAIVQVGGYGPYEATIEVTAGPESDVPALLEQAPPVLNCMYRGTPGCPSQCSDEDLKRCGNTRTESHRQVPRQECDFAGSDWCENKCPMNHSFCKQYMEHYGKTRIQWRW